MAYMFYKTEFNSDISKWNVNKVEDAEHMFTRSSFDEELPELLKKRFGKRLTDME